MATNTHTHDDPIQGHDVFVWTAGIGTDGNAPVAAFNDLMFKVVNQTETYLPLFTRIPRFLDGEIIIVWSCSAGVLGLDFIENTFGKSFANGIAEGRTAKIKRSKRFHLSATVATGETGFSEETMARTGSTNLNNTNGEIALMYCRADSLSFGVAAGKGFAVNSWQGTAEGLDDAPATTQVANLPAIQ